MVPCNEKDQAFLDAGSDCGMSFAYGGHKSCGQFDVIGCVCFRYNVPHYYRAKDQEVLSFNEETKQWEYCND